MAISPGQFLSCRCRLALLQPGSPLARKSNPEDYCKVGGRSIIPQNLPIVVLIHYITLHFSLDHPPTWADSASLYTEVYPRRQPQHYKSCPAARPGTAERFRRYGQRSHRFVVSCNYITTDGEMPPLPPDKHFVLGHPWKALTFEFFRNQIHPPFILHHIEGYVPTRMDDTKLLIRLTIVLF